MNKNEQKFMQLCIQVFDSPNGKELMRFLDEMLKSPVADPTKSANFAFWREGQNNLIRRLMYAKDTRDNQLRGEND